MAESIRIKQPTDDQLLLLMEKQMLAKEGSSEWHELQQRINQIIAERFLRFVNR